ncbi:MAG: hypothetical protein JSW33_13230, partial [bacterium]
MRKKGLVFLIGLFGIFMLFFLLLTDRWLENRMESTGSAIVGAKVEFDGVDFSFLKLKMKWDSLRVTNPEDTWRNTFETGKVEFDVDLLPLFSKKYIIENVELQGLRFNTPRKTDGKLKKEETQTTESEVVKAIEQRLSQETAEMPVFNLKQYGKKVNLDSLWKMVDLKTPHKIDSLKKVYIEEYRNWEKRINDLPSEKELQVYTREIESIKIDQIKTVDEFQAAYNKANNIYKQLDSTYQSVNTLRADFEKDIKDIKT